MKYTREGKPTTYIHYGSPAFSPVKFVPAMQEGCWVKPKGGLWASPVDAERSWKDWCEGEGFRECNEDNSFKFTVRDPKRIFYIDSEEAFDDWYSRYVTERSGGLKWAFSKGFNCGLDQIEVDKMKADGWDGLEISLTDHWPLYNYLYGWDCDSIVIFNRDAVVPVA